MQVVSLALAEEKALSLALNKVSGDWDEPALALLLRDLTECDEIDTALTGFEAAEIDVLLADLSSEAAAEPEPVAVAGSYKVMATCRNKGEQDRVMKLLKRQKVACHTITRG